MLPFGINELSHFQGGRSVGRAASKGSFGARSMPFRRCGVRGEARLLTSPRRRVWWGGAPFNGIRDRSRRELRVDSGVRGTQHASRRGTPWGVKPVDNGPTSASHTADERATPAIEADVKEPAEASSQTTGASG